MDNNLQTNNQRPGIGAGIITLAVLIFIFNAITLVTTFGTLSNLDEINRLSAQYGGPTTSSTQIIINLVICAINIISFILILLWKRIGVYLYFGAVILGLVISFINLSKLGALAGFGFIGVAIGLIIPILLIVFLKSKFKYFT
ncbi:MAG: hypothetical protein AB6733_03415 [Clostridiaceae bacterium]